MSQTSIPAVAGTATAPADQAVPAAGSSSERPLTTADRCDACGAQAYVRVVLASGELLFCAHHGHANMAALDKQALFIQDESARLASED